MRSFAFALLLAAAAVASAQIAAPVSAASMSAATAAAGAAFQTGVSPSDAVAAATVLNKAGQKATSAQCSTIHGLVSSVTKPGDAGRVAVASKLAGCALPSSVSSKLSPLVTEALTGPCLPAVAFGVQAASIVGAPLDAGAAAQHVLSFAGEGGLFAPLAPPSKPTAAYTASGWTALASLAPKLAKDPASAAVLKRIKGVAKSANAALGSVTVASDAASLGHVAAAAVRLGSSLKLGASAINANVLSDSAGALALQMKSSSVSSLAGALTGLKQVGTKKAAGVSSGAPVAVSLSSANIAPAGEVTVLVQSVFGDAVPATVTLTKAVTADKKGKPVQVAKDVALGESSVLSSAVAAWAPGRYMLTLSVTPKGSDFAAGTAKRVLVIANKVQWNEAVVLVSKTASSAGATLGQQRAVVAHPKTAPKPFSAGSAQYIHVLFSGKAGAEELTARQVLVHLTHVASGATAVFKPAVADAGTHGFKVTIDVGDRNALGDAVIAGEYSLSLVAGSAGIQGSAWEVARVALSPAAAVPGPVPPLYTKHLLHDSNVALGPLPELEHVFRQPEARPASVVSLFFSGLVAAPLVVLVGYYMAQAGNVSWRKNVPFVSAAVFHVALGAALVLFGAYFFDMVNMFECLILLAVIAVPLMLGGSPLLRALRAADEAEAGK